MIIGNFNNVVEQIRKLPMEGSYLIATHRRADVDAYLSVYLLNKLFLSLPNFNGEISIYIPQGISTRIESLSSILPLNYFSTLNRSDIDRYNACFYLDVGGLTVIPGLEDIMKIADLNFLIDHHQHETNFIKMFDVVYIDNENYSSTCEIIFDIGQDIYKNFVSKLSEDDVIGIISAIYVESRFFQIAKPKTFLKLYYLSRQFKKECPLIYVLNLVRPKLERSEKIALLKGMQRIEIYEANGILIAISNLSAFQSSLASRLIGLGVDIALVFGIENGQCKVSIRLSDNVRSKLGLNATDSFLEIFRKYISCEGGGHPGSAMIVFNHDDIYKVKKLVINVLKDILKVSGLTLRPIT